MKILLITTLYPTDKDQSRKDISFALHYFAKDWMKMGHEVKVIKVLPVYPAIFNYFKNSSSQLTNGQFELEGVKVNRIAISKIPRIDYFQKDIKKIFNRILLEINNTKDRPDIILCHMINPSIYISKMLKEEFNLPLVLTIHQTDIYQLMKKGNLLRKFAEIEPYINRLGFRSQSLLERYNEFNLPQKNKFLIQSGINNELIISDSKLNKKINSKTKVIFVAASFIRLKNIDIVIKAFEKIANIENAYLRIAGDGPEKDYLTRLVNKSDVNERIKFLGHIDRDLVIKEMENSDIFTMVSSPETFGLVYIEAMAKACITIGSKGEGIDGVIKDNVNGYLCEPRNIDQLSKILSKALNLNNEEKGEIITNAVKMAKDMTQEKISQRYINILKDTISQSQSESS